MEPQPSKRQRREPVFTASERELLITLVENHWDVLENKKTDADSVREKTERWKILGEQFNANSSNHLREWIKLKTLWENLKKRAKAAVADVHYDLAGGDKGKKIPCDPIMRKVIGLVRPGIDALEQMYDDEYVDELYDNVDDSISSSPSVLSQQRRLELRQEVITKNDCTHNQSMLTAPRAFHVRPGQPVEQRIGDIENYPVIFDVDPEKHLWHTPIEITVDKTTPAPHRPVSDTSIRPEQKQPTANALQNARLTKLKSRASQEQYAVELEILQLKRDQEKTKLEQEKMKLEQEKVKLKIERENLRRAKVQTALLRREGDCEATESNTENE